MADRYDQREKRIRDGFIFALGILGSINELWIVEEPRPYALAFLASLIGVPFILHADARRRNGNHDKNGGNNDSKTRE